ncbi:MAG TPA: lactate utilization protein C [Rhodocyclaceae bacterium]|jgi:L-lactate dehydrogenase complex protein LldG|nr:lactate utilization protein C [Rhodocyclaceae bacterium]
MSSREDILKRVRERLGRGAQNVDAARVAVEEALRSPAEGPRPPVGPDLAAEFRRRSEALSSTVDAVAAIAEVPAAVARYLREAGLPLQAACVPALAGLDWAGAGLAVEPRGAHDEDLVGITGCFSAIAETGTLMLCSAPESPATVSLLPETHVAVVPVGRIVAGMEEAWALARRELGELPRAVNFVSGPSRTGDIEQTIVLGAHGPYRVHIVLVERG